MKVVADALQVHHYHTQAFFVTDRQGCAFLGKSRYIHPCIQCSESECNKKSLQRDVENFVLPPPPDVKHQHNPNIR